MDWRYLKLICGAPIAAFSEVEGARKASERYHDTIPSFRAHEDLFLYFRLVRGFYYLSTHTTLFSFVFHSTRILTHVIRSLRSVPELQAKLSSLEGSLKEIHQQLSSAQVWARNSSTLSAFLFFCGKESYMCVCVAVSLVSCFLGAEQRLFESLSAVLVRACSPSPVTIRTIFFGWRRRTLPCGEVSSRSIPPGRHSKFCAFFVAVVEESPLGSSRLIALYSSLLASCRSPIFSAGPPPLIGRLLTLCHVLQTMERLKRFSSEDNVVDRRIVVKMLVSETNVDLLLHPPTRVNVSYNFVSPFLYLRPVFP